MNLPGDDGWMLPPDFLSFLEQEIADRRPAFVLELGSGRSTAVISAAVMQYGGRLVSLEHDEAFYRRTLSFGGHGVLLAPLRPVSGVSWYSPAAWDNLNNIDMLVVDGPPGGSGLYARYPALPLLKERLSPVVAVYLDDTHRAEEEATLWRWVALHPGRKTVTRINHSKGQATRLVIEP